MSEIKWIVGVDEVGRGPLAGPVYIGVYAYKKNKDTKFLTGIKDSKLLTQEKRENWKNILEQQKNVFFTTSSTNAKFIDEKGIVWSIQSAIKRALKKLEIKPHLCEVLLDGGLKAPEEYIHQKTIVRGDQTVPVISAASIIAKVKRDKRMFVLSKKYPEYDFGKNKGYGTKYHREMIYKHGLSKEHRKSYCKNIISSKV